MAKKPKAEAEALAQDDVAPSKAQTVDMDVVAAKLAAGQPLSIAEADAHAEAEAKATAIARGEG